MVFSQIFLTFCTMVTLYFAKEVPLAPKQHLRLSDVAPLLEDSQAQQHDPDQTESKPRKNAVDHKVGNMPESVFELDTSEKNADPTSYEDQVEIFSDSPGAVLVNLLTSLRHLPSGMHSVLIVMALTWVSLVDVCCVAFSNRVFGHLFTPTFHMCSCPGFLFSFLIQIGWVEKFIMVTQRELPLKS